VYLLLQKISVGILLRLGRRRTRRGEQGRYGTFVVDAGRGERGVGRRQDRGEQSSDRQAPPPPHRHPRPQPRRLNSANKPGGRGANTSGQLQRAIPPQQQQQQQRGRKTRRQWSRNQQPRKTKAPPPSLSDGGRTRSPVQTRTPNDAAADAARKRERGESRELRRGRMVGSQPVLGQGSGRGEGSRETPTSRDAGAAGCAGPCAPGGGGGGGGGRGGGPGPHPPPPPPPPPISPVQHHAAAPAAAAAADAADAHPLHAAANGQALFPRTGPARPATGAHA
jgi:hypothetical protein